MKKLPLVLVSISTLALAACGGGGGGTPDARPFADARESADAMGNPDAAGNVDAGADDAATDDASVADASPDAMADASPDAMLDAAPPADADPNAPMVTSLDYTTAPRGGLLTVNGTQFTGATDVTIDGISQPFTVVSDSVITIDGIDATTTLGTDDLIVVGSSPSVAVQVSVIDLTVTPTVVAVGSHPTIASTTFTFDTGNTTISIGGVSQTTGTVNTTDFDIAGVTGVTAGSQNLLISSGGTDIAPLPIPVAELVINEADPNTPGSDAAEFVEIATGLPSTAITGYVLVFWNGNATNDASYDAFDLNVTTDANGFVLLGNPGVTPTPVITFSGNGLQNGTDAISISQGSTADFASGTAISPQPTGTFLIDALAYGSSADDALVQALLGTGPEAVLVNENVNGAGDTESMSRCTAGRLDDRNFVVGTPTPGAANSCP